MPSIIVSLTPRYSFCSCFNLSSWIVAVKTLAKLSEMGMVKMSFSCTVEVSLCCLSDRFLRSQWFGIAADIEYQYDTGCLLRDTKFSLFLLWEKYFSPISKVFISSIIHVLMLASMIMAYEGVLPGKDGSSSSTCKYCNRSRIFYHSTSVLCVSLREYQL